MKIVDKKLRWAIMMSCYCDICKDYYMTGVDPAHIIARGFGGGSQVDIPENLAGLCRRHHLDNHAGRLTQADLWAAVGRRLGKPATECEQTVRDTLRRRA